jgi:hypothetical protein
VTGVPGIDQSIGLAAGTSPAVAHDGWRPGALVLVRDVNQRPGGCYYDLVVVVAALRAGSRWLDAGH